MLDILHGIAITSGTSYLGHKSRIILILEFSHAYAHINDGLIDQQFRTTYWTEVELLLRR